MVPLLHGAMVKGNCAEGLATPGAETAMLDEVAHVVSLPVGTSEYW